jgi:hypothetical protein
VRVQYERLSEEEEELRLGKWKKEEHTTWKMKNENGFLFHLFV